MNLLLCLVLSEPLAVAGLAIASAVSSTVYALLLLLPLERRGEHILSGGFAGDLLKMLLAAAAMGLCAAGALAGLEAILPGGKLGELLALGGCALAGMAVYFVLALALGLDEARLSVRWVKQLVKRG